MNPIDLLNQWITEVEQDKEPVIPYNVHPMIRALLEAYPKDLHTGKRDRLYRALETIKECAEKQ